MKKYLVVIEKCTIAIICFSIVTLTLTGCLFNHYTSQDEQPQSEENHRRSIIHPEGLTIKERFTPPQGFERVYTEPDTFAHYLQSLPLKADGVKVHYYDGRVKNKAVHEAVIDIDVGERDLQQCADAIMRLRAEYLYAQKRQDEIAFHFTNGFLAEYKEWMKGRRISVQGNDVSWVSGGEATDSYDSFRKYLDMVFAYAGTLSLSQELIPRPLQEMEIGDVFIQGGSPGHGVIVVDIAINPMTNEKIFIVAQSYMPAQDIHILKNPEDNTISPWYSTSTNRGFHTPEWTFKAEDLKGF